MKPVQGMTVSPQVWDCLYCVTLADGAIRMASAVIKVSHEACAQLAYSLLWARAVALSQA